MTKATIKRNAACPCGSTLLAKDCCYPVKAPVTMPTPQYVKCEQVPVSAALRSQQVSLPESVKREITSRLTQTFNITLKYSNESGPGLLPKEQSNQQIAQVLGYGPNDYHLDRVRNEHRLIGPLHSVKYHQQQCMYRLFLVQQRSKKIKRTTIPPSPNSINLTRAIQFEDFPLRAEFEAFISCIASALDALSKYTCSCIGHSSEKYGSHFKLTKHLKNVREGVDWLDSLREIYLSQEAWARTIMREMRDYVIHEGTLWALEAGKDISMEQPFDTPSFQGKGIEWLCLEYWKNLISFVEEIRNTLLEYRFTT